MRLRNILLVSHYFKNKNYNLFINYIIIIYLFTLLQIDPLNHKLWNIIDFSFLSFKNSS